MMGLGHTNLYLVFILYKIASYLQGLGGGGVKGKEKGIENPSLPTESSGFTFLTFPTPLL